MARRHHALREPRESCVPHRDARLSDSIIIMPHFFNMNTWVSMASSRDRARLLHSILVVLDRLVELPGAG